MIPGAWDPRSLAGPWGGAIIGDACGAGVWRATREEAGTTS
jgi:hypothetical protein